MIDFTDPGVIKWVGEQFDKHPEMLNLILPVNPPVNIDEELKKPQAERRSNWDDPILKLLEEGKIEQPPGKPNQKAQAAGGKIDWEAWFLYYQLNEMNGKHLEYKEIAAFIGEQFYSINPKTGLINPVSTQAVRTKFSEIIKSMQTIKT
jgi:hypothetical protein